MKKINFTCPNCGGHKVFSEQPFRWIQLDIIGFDDDGNLLFDHDRPRIVDGNSAYFEIYCDNCYAEVPLKSIREMFNKEEK